MLGQLFKHWTWQVFAPGALLRSRYDAFRKLLADDKRSLELITELEEIHYGQAQADWEGVAARVRALDWSVSSLIRDLVAMNPAAYRELEPRFDEVRGELLDRARLETQAPAPPWVLSLGRAVDNPHLVGGKSLNLSRVMMEGGLPVPPGFCVTTSSCRLLLEQEEVASGLVELLAQVRLDEPGRLEELSAEMRALVLDAPLPAKIADALEERVERLLAETGRGVRLAVRSSASGEDGDVSFAGQYESVLEVEPGDVVRAYLRVVASKYSPRALAYRVRYGLADTEAPMAVLVLAMIEAEASGVVYTLDPVRGAPPHVERLAVYAVPGLGEHLVDGSSVPDMYYWSREKRPRLLKTVSQREAQEGVAGRIGTNLDSVSVRTLAHWGMELERLYGGPQDMEWAMAPDGELYIVQTRPLAVGETWRRDENVGERAGESEPEIEAEVLYAGGETASAGVAAGPVHELRPGGALRDVPGGSVLVTGVLSPDFTSLIGRVRAVVAEQGSRASHFASVAREFGLPVIVGARGALQELAEGFAVTVDAGSRRVYDGVVKVLLEREEAREERPETPLSRRLSRIMPLVSPLSLTDPEAGEFAPGGCRSMHDFVRYCHEKGVAEMFTLVGRNARGLGQARKLVTDLPLVLYVLDVENGLAGEGRGDVRIEEVTSRPMQALWKGLTHSDTVWDKGLLHVDWEEFDRVSGGIMAKDSRALASYAVISHDYVHAMIRFGYHFAVVDSLCGDAAEANYVSFRFKGGGADFSRRLLRLDFIRRVLEMAGFAITMRGDLMDARFARRDRGATLGRIGFLGVLLGQTRLLDMAMHDAAQAEEMAEEFAERYGPEFLAARNEKPGPPARGAPG